MANYNIYTHESYAPSASPMCYAQQYSSSHQSYGQSSSYGYSSALAPSYAPYFPPGTHPDIIRSFQMIDRDRSGFVDKNELQEVLSWGYQKFSLRTIRLLMFLFKNPTEPSRIGPVEFAALWNCLGQWRVIFERFDRDRSGRIDSMELRDALYSLGYAVPPSVLQALISKYDRGSEQNGQLNFDSFIECGMIVKGLTEKFKEKDPHYTGAATLTYDTFMAMIVPFLVS
ncbi:PREDICTED: probable calcium-binding protein CML48 [Nelumbo nucifera]|uniref:Probable calcium-binding protein CML48 n=1 Tax=Nelumbo nucifera TaxID=4432 RepID=A0A1U8AY51_NELNU|nr:PREDICTED: probable calcium-binding protein CML48 [Nelumbo nucifera]